MEVEKIDRINALAHKAKSVGLTEEEKKERELLRKEYIASVRMNLRAQLDNVDVQQEDGTIINAVDFLNFHSSSSCFLSTAVCL